MTPPDSAAAHLLPARLIRPTAEGMLVRERLCQRLDAIFGSPARIAWVNGPAGSGKTVLASSYIESRFADALWYQLDESDADPAAFFHYLTLAADADPPVNSQRLPQFGPEHLAAPASFARRYFDQLATRFASPAFLVFDNYHELPDGADLNQLIRIAGERLPRHARLLVLSRGEPPPCFARWLLYGQIATLNWNDLRLSLDEAAALVALQTAESDVPAPDDWIAQAYAATHGWMAGMTLLIRARCREAQVNGAKIPSERHLLFDYFSNEVFSRLPPESQRILLALHVLPHMTARVAQELTGDRSTVELLATLRRNHFLLMTREDGETIYEFHPLFADFLVSRATVALPPDERHRLQVRAAELLVTEGETESALELFAAAGEGGALAQLLLSEAPAFLAQGRNRNLDAWITRVPQDDLAPRPWLLYWQGLARLPFAPRSARECFENAYDLAENTNDPTTLYTFCTAVTDAYHIEWNDFVPLARWLGRYELLRERYPDYPSPDIEMRALSIIAPLTDHCPDYPALPQLVERAGMVVRAPGPTMPRLMLAINVLEHYVFTGQLAAGQRIAVLLQDMLTVPEAPVTIVLQGYFWSALFRAARGELATAKQLGEAGLARARESGVHVLDLLLHCGLTLASVAAGDGDAARRHVRSLEQSLPGGTQHMIGASYHHVAALEALLNGDNPGAERHARNNIADGKKAGFPFAEAVGHLLLATALHRAGPEFVDEVQLHAGNARKLAGTMRSETLQYLCDLLEATRALDMGDTSLGHAALRRGLARSRLAGDLVWPMWGPAALSRLYCEALEQDIETGHVRNMICRLRLMPPKSAPECWPWPIRIYTLGRFDILINGLALTFSGKVQRKPLELLKALIALGSERVPEARLAEILWPDTDGDGAHRDFATTLHRLRRLLGHHQALLLEFGYLRLNRQIVWLDVDAFAASRTRFEQDSPNGLTSTAARAADLYRGEFLPGEDSAWACPLRGQAQGWYERIVRIHGQSLERSGQPNDAIEWYRAALYAAPLAVGIHGGLIRCLASLGRSLEAVEAYQHYRALSLPQNALGDDINRWLRDVAAA